MVKNTTGGSGAKSLARKNQSSHDSKIRYATDPFERYAIVTKMLGNNMCRVTLSDGNELLAHIRNKFSGRNKRHNLITPLSIVLVALRDFETTPSNCDIIFIFSDLHFELLSHNPSIDISRLSSIKFPSSLHPQHEHLSFLQTDTSLTELHPTTFTTLPLQHIQFDFDDI